MIKHLLALSITVLISIANQTKAQQTIRCGTTEVMQQYSAKHPEYVQKRAEIESRILDFIARGQAKGVQQQIVIPVVVHVIYNTDEENISDEIVQSQIEVLNQDYSYTNPDKGNVPLPFQQYAADCQISFCLAGVDPSGNYTNGIIHKQTAATEFTTEDKMKSSNTGGDDPWPCEKYLNIWVCDLANGYLGYTFQPGADCSIDGVVIDSKHFGVNGDLGGNYNLDRTTTHEVGHWFNLNHPWGNNGSNDQCLDDDGVGDTPHSPGPNYNCKNFPNNVSLTCLNSPYGDMFMNFMDYSYDNCMYFFTQGQKARMVAAVNTSRPSFLEFTNCTVGVGEMEINANKISTYPNPTNGMVNFSFQNELKTQAFTVTLTDVLGQKVYSIHKPVSQHSVEIQTLSLQEGNYFAQISSDKVNVVKKVVVIR